MYLEVGWVLCVLLVPIVVVGWGLMDLFSYLFLFFFIQDYVLGGGWVFFSVMDYIFGGWICVVCIISPFLKETGTIVNDFSFM